jgi:hypothetical protein
MEERFFEDENGAIYERTGFIKVYRKFMTRLYIKHLDGGMKQEVETPPIYFSNLSLSHVQTAQIMNLAQQMLDGVPDDIEKNFKKVKI